MSSEVPQFICSTALLFMKHLLGYLLHVASISSSAVPGYKHGLLLSSRLHVSMPSALHNDVSPSTMWGEVLVFEASRKLNTVAMGVQVCINVW